MWYANEKDEKGIAMMDFIQLNDLEITNRQFQPSTRKSGTNLTLETINRAHLLKNWTVFPEFRINDHNSIYFKGTKIKIHGFCPLWTLYDSINR